MVGVERIVIISCGKRKLARPAPARELYTGPYFKAMLGYALTIAPAEPELSLENVAKCGNK